MNESEFELTRNILKRRIEETRRWAEEGFSWEIGSVALRHLNCNVIPIKFFNENNRREAQGVCFQLIWLESKGETCAYIDVRFVPEGSYSKNGSSIESFPYVVIYAVDNNGKEDEITHKELNPAGCGEGLSIQEFYKKWLEEGCKSKQHYKIFQYKKLLEI